MKSLLQLRCESLFNRRLSTPLDRSEQVAWKRAEECLKSFTEDEWQAIEAFYEAPQEETYARKGLAQFLNNCNSELSKAIAWRQVNGLANEKPQSVKIGGRIFSISQPPKPEECPQGMHGEFVKEWQRMTGNK
jgi:hypothetical protein